MATFKFIKVQVSPNSSSYTTICKVRVYVIPNDAPGSRFITEWRSLKPKNLNLEKRFTDIWFKLLEVLDYSKKNWHCISSKSTLSQYIGRGVLLISTTAASDGTRYEIQDNLEINFHIDRWAQNRPFESYSRKPSNTSKESFGAKVLQIYNNITSPNLTEYENKESNFKESNSLPSPEDVIIELLRKSKIGTHSIKGVFSRLYPFQVMSVCKMFEKESIDRKALVPNFIRIKSPNSDIHYYFDMTNKSFYSKPELYSLPRGGILAENMGLGKTLICLSLVCLTKCDVSGIPPSYLLYNGNENEKIAENLFEYDSNSTSSWKSLAELCKECINQNSLPWKHYIEDIPISVVNRLSSSPGYFRIPLENHGYDSIYSLRTRKTSSRQKLINNDLSPEGRIYRTLYLCNTTLIIIPDNLFHQWNNELKKHIEPSFLDKLFVSSQFKEPIYSQNSTFMSELPDDPKYLVKFDMILITHSLLAKQLGNLNKYDNPLDMIYWKRLIIDEGHSVQSKNSRTSLLCKSLHSERRWAVTGTPTSGLTRLHMDEEQTETLAQNNETKLKMNHYVVKSKFNERDDLNKLGTIVSNFLKIEPFHSQPKVWTNSIIKPLTSNSYGSTVSLSNLLDAIVVRHALKDIELNLKLPALHHQPVFLKPSYHNKIAINLFTAVLAVNAVSSERIDVDYMFHPSNRQQLRRLITNLQRATFHWTGFKQNDIETLIHICNLSLKKRKASGNSVYSDYDISLLKKSIEVSKIALNNPRWRTIALLHEMNYYVSGLPDIFTKTYGTGVLEVTDQSGKRDDISVFGAPHLNAIQEFFYKNRFMDMNNEEALRSKLYLSSKPFWSSYWKDNMKRNSERFNKQDNNQSLNSNVKAEEIENAINVPSIVKNFKPESELQAPELSTPKSNKTHGKIAEVSPKERLVRNDGEGLKLTDEIKTNQSIDDHNINYQSIKTAQILGTASAKLSYLASRLLEHQQEKAKSLVFFEFEDSAYYLTELLEVLGIKYILYATFINPSQRTNNLTEFSNFPGGVTLIMDLRLASHGLTILSATRVYFINPVWQRSIEAQAIKRAHRIGQTKDVYVETLVLKGTLEEEIYKRRFSNEESVNDVRDETDKSQKRYVIDDTGMQEFILRHNFLEHEANEQEFAPFVAPAINPDSSINDDTQNLSLEYSLLNHKDALQRTKDSGLLKEWKTYLFNEDNLAFSSNIKNQRLNKKFSQNEFLRKFVDPKEQDTDLNTDEKKTKTHIDGPRHKKVRF
ncbi:uncharacterized protein AC631_01706 [Debaryomyces fabryi]|uniref:Helicase C-terminal domain-containing protein n=1 Tax=Debaryomyces fabryi TaxID=58627 RepID=A0A0V1Q237_9ASCO|nr:uncharacterized protein AC631_01706 [Debaryomyces fabryi]KSA02531.1 hypothetical protein AC631_01706 [Debaryomyces fabryi]